MCSLKISFSIGEKGTAPYRSLSQLRVTMTGLACYCKPQDPGDPYICRCHYNNWRVLIGRLNYLSDIADEYSTHRDESNSAQFLRTWRMRIFQLRGPAMQAELFNQRSKRLKLRLILRSWREKLRLKTAVDSDMTEQSLTDRSDRAHTAPITPNRSTRRHLWRTLNSR
jgi:hypothetical protein